MKLRQSLFRVLGMVFMLAALIASLLTAVDWASFSRPFYAERYRTLDTAAQIGVSQADLDAATEKLLDYIQAREESLEIEVELISEKGSRKVLMFNPREVEHMVDVQKLYLKAIFVRNMLLMISVLAIFLLVILRQRVLSQTDFKCWRQGLFIGLALFVMVIVSIAAYAFLDFESFWTRFHLLFFSNDLWILNPLTDRLIQMVPSAFFSALVSRIIITSCIALVFISSLSLGLTQYCYKRSISLLKRQ